MASHVTAAISMKLPSIEWAALAVSGLANDTSAIPPTAQAMPATVRSAMRSRKKTRDNKATTAGSAAMMTPAAKADVSAMP